MSFSLTAPFIWSTRTPAGYVSSPKPLPERVGLSSVDKGWRVDGGCPTISALPRGGHPGL